MGCLCRVPSVGIASKSKRFEVAVDRHLQLHRGHLRAGATCRDISGCGRWYVVLYHSVRYSLHQCEHYLVRLHSQIVRAIQVVLERSHFSRGQHGRNFNGTYNKHCLKYLSEQYYTILIYIRRNGILVREIQKLCTKIRIFALKFFSQYSCLTIIIWTICWFWTMYLIRFLFSRHKLQMPGTSANPPPIQPLHLRRPIRTVRAIKAIRAIKAATNIRACLRRTLTNTRVIPLLRHRTDPIRAASHLQHPRRILHRVRRKMINKYHNI